MHDQRDRVALNVVVAQSMCFKHGVRTRDTSRWPAIQRVTLQLQIFVDVADEVSGEKRLLAWKPNTEPAEVPGDDGRGNRLWVVDIQLTADQPRQSLVCAVAGI